ncbi:hypothetical protein [Leptolyngbya sp. BL0902]|uniref:hypothetical protein n=1 Tax=Leptolyngbya sp. BL0902 TaxID=1115757 RepID=UPI0018E8B7D4|nr:hypothetical protein [Leptolyngbya sp. BL0902]
MADPLVPGPFTLSFPGGHCAQALWLGPHHTIHQALDPLGLERPRPTLVIVGGAGLMETASMQRLQVLFNEVLAPLAQDLRLTVIDGGTDAGVMQLMGQARHRLGGTFPLVGVLPQGQARFSDFHAMALLEKQRLTSATSSHSPESAGEIPPDLPLDWCRPASPLPNGPRLGCPECDLEPHHTHFLLTPGHAWGSESPWLSDLATAIAQPQPALTLLVNGGKIATTDFHINLAAGRPMLVLAGSGRLADEVAAALTAKADDIPPALREAIQRYQPSGALVSLDIRLPAEDLRQQLSAYFIG